MFKASEQMTWALTETVHVYVCVLEVGLGERVSNKWNFRKLDPTCQGHE